MTLSRIIQAPESRSGWLVVSTQEVGEHGSEAHVPSRTHGQCECNRDSARPVFLEVQVLSDQLRAGAFCSWKASTESPGWKASKPSKPMLQFWPAASSPPPPYSSTVDISSTTGRLGGAF